MRVQLAAMLRISDGMIRVEPKHGAGDTGGMYVTLTPALKEFTVYNAG